MSKTKWFRKTGGPTCPACGGQMRGGNRGRHHIVYEQHVRDVGRVAHRRGVKKPDVYDLRNLLIVCTRCHAAHHARTRVIELAILPSAAFEFAAELFGPGKAFNYLRRRYAGQDLRLDALLAASAVI